MQTLPPPCRLRWWVPPPASVCFLPWPRPSHDAPIHPTPRSCPVLLLVVSEWSRIFSPSTARMVVCMLLSPPFPDSLIPAVGYTIDCCQASKQASKEQRRDASPPLSPSSRLALPGSRREPKVSFHSSTLRPTCTSPPTRLAHLQAPFSASLLHPSILPSRPNSLRSNSSTLTARKEKCMLSPLLAAGARPRRFFTCLLRNGL